MGKEKTPPKFGEKQAGATAKFLRIPPRKARLVIDAVRGKYVSDALAILKFVPNFAAEAIADVIKSAVANAENSRPISEVTGKPLDPLIAENLKLVRAHVDEGPRIKRLQPRAQGRAYRILKRMCHITVIVEEVAPKPRPVRQTKASQRAKAAGRTATVTATPAPAPKVEEKAVEQEVTTAAVAPTEETTPVAESTASVAAETDVQDEIGAPITTEADVEATNEKNETIDETATSAEEAPASEASADAPKAE